MKKALILCLFLIPIITLAQIVVVSIKPLALIVQSICPEDVQIKVIMSNTNPHLYELKISDMNLLQKADLIVLSGIEDWAGKVQELFGSKTLVFSDYVFEHIATEDRHLWLDPIYAVIFSHIIYQRLSQIAPQNSDIYQQNWKNFADTIIAKTFEWYEKTSVLRNKSIFEQHPALTHFAKRFGIKQVISLETGHEEGITTKKLSEIISILKKEKVRYMVVEKDIYSLAAKNVAEQLNLSLVEVDVLAQDCASYEDLIDSIVNTLVNAENTHR